MEVTEKYEYKFTYEMANRNIFLLLDTQKNKSLNIFVHVISIFPPQQWKKQTDFTCLLLTFCTVKANASEHKFTFKKGPFYLPIYSPKTGRINPDLGTVPSLR